jgi:nitroreductase
MPDIEADSLLRTRRSVPLHDLRDPGPDQATLEKIMTAALRVPDHSRLMPWRVQVVRGGAREQLAESIAAAYVAETPTPDAGRLAKVKAMPQSAPVLLVVSSKLTRGHKVPEIEQLLSGGALCQNILLAAHAAGFGGFWLTGFSAYSPQVKQALGIEMSEHILGFIALGTAAREPAERSRPLLRDIVSEWSGTPEVNS